MAGKMQARKLAIYGGLVLAITTGSAQAQYQGYQPYYGTPQAGYNAQAYAPQPQAYAQPAQQVPQQQIQQQIPAAQPQQAQPQPQPQSFAAAPQATAAPNSGVPQNAPAPATTVAAQDHVEYFPASANSNAGLNGLESFQYPANTEPGYPAYVTPKAHDSARTAAFSAVGLNTTSGGEIGLQLSDYRYQEHIVPGDDFMHLQGANFGATLAATKAFGNNWFIGGDGRLTYGSHDYKGGDIDVNSGLSVPSTHNGEDDFSAEIRVTGGYDFIFMNAFDSSYNFSVSPYAGLGFRFLNNDGTGNDSNGVPGYTRDSHYFYLPIGLTPRFRVTDDTRMSINLEYDQLLYGWQTSELSDAISGASDLTNNQFGGYGFRTSVMYEWVKWSVGPFFNYWNIDQSDVACSAGICGVEPHNQTIEYGVQAHYRFH